MTEHEEARPGPQELMSVAMRWLVEHPDAPLAKRVCCAVVVASGGDIDGPCTIAEVAHYAGCEPSEALQALYAVREQDEAKRDA